MNLHLVTNSREIEIEIQALIEEPSTKVAFLVKKKMVITPTTIFQDLGHFVVREILQPYKCQDSYSLTYEGIIVFNHPNILKFLKKRDHRIFCVIFHQDDKIKENDFSSDTHILDSIFDRFSLSL